MATGLKSRIIAREKTQEFTVTDYWAGNYAPLGRAKSIPTPYGDPNMVDVSTLEDLMEVQEEGRRSAPSMEIPIAFTKASKDAVMALEGKVLDIVILYGTDGQGGEGAAAFTGTISFRPDEATEDHLTATLTVAIKTVPVSVEDYYTITVTEDANGYLTTASLSATAGTKSIALDKASIGLTVGAYETITATVRPAGSAVVWTTDDSEIATVSSGVVHAVGAGTCTITATNDSVSATCDVTVTAAN